MPTKTVYYIPGILGSQMDQLQPILPNRLWVEPARIALGQTVMLKLSAGGRLPDPDVGATCRPGGPLEEYYGSAFAQMLLDLDLDEWFVQPWGYDWRKDLSQQGLRLAVDIETHCSSEYPATIVAHSQGGLIARMAWYSLKSRGLEGLCRRIVTIGTPHEGCYSPVNVFAGEDEAIDQIIRAETLTAGLLNLTPVAPTEPLPHTAIQLANIAATWPALYMLLPLVNEHTLAADPDRPAMYDASNYPSDQHVSATWLAYANGPWNTILNSELSKPPSDVLIAVGGRGFATEDKVNSVSAIGHTSAYGSTSDGDGRVTLDSAIPVWASGEVVYGQHGDLMLRPPVLGSLKRWIETEFAVNPPLTGWISLRPPATTAPPAGIVQGPPFLILPPLWYDP